jgi:hypothetical protein
MVSKNEQNTNFVGKQKQKRTLLSSRITELIKFLFFKSVPITADKPSTSDNGLQKGRSTLALMEIKHEYNSSSVGENRGR